MPAFRRSWPLLFILAVGCTLPGPDALPTPILAVDGRLYDEGGRPCTDCTDLTVGWYWFRNARLEEPGEVLDQRTSVDEQGRFRLEVIEVPPPEARFDGRVRDEEPQILAMGFADVVTGYPDETQVSEARPLWFVLVKEAPEEPWLRPGWNQALQLEGELDMIPVENQTARVELRLGPFTGRPVVPCGALRLGEVIQVLTPDAAEAELLGEEDAYCNRTSEDEAVILACPDFLGLLCDPGCTEQRVLRISSFDPRPFNWPCPLDGQRCTSIERPCQDGFRYTCQSQRWTPVATCL